MSNNELIKELEEKFKQVQHELGFKSTFKQIDDIFFITDNILHSRFVSSQLSRQICSRIVDTYMSWNNYLHNLVMPSPGYMIHMNESKMLDENDKKLALKIIAQSMALISDNSLVGLTKDKVEEAKFIDSSVDFWHSSYKPQLENIMRKVRDGWKR